MPYLYGAAVEAHRDGIPMMRPIVLEFPDDPASATLERQYMLGSSLLVVPVLSEDGVADYYLPAGRWTHLLTGEVQTGGRWHRSQHDFLSMPLWVKAGSVLALGQQDSRPDYEFTESTLFRVYDLADGVTATCQVPNQKGEPGSLLKVTRKGQQIEAVLDGTASGNWQIQLVGVKSVTSVEGGAAQSDPLGIVLASTNPTIRHISLKLS